MRELTVDFTKENPLEGGAEAGYIGEHNATELVIIPSEEIKNSGSAFFEIVFLCEGRIFRTEQLEPAEEFRVPLEAHLTQCHYLSLQIEGYSDTYDCIYKSPMVSKLHFHPSIQGNESEIDPEAYQIYHQVALNTRERHRHSNTEVLNGFTENNGKLYYNSEPVCKNGKEKTVTLLYPESQVDVLLDFPLGNSLEFTYYGTLEDFPVPQNAKILKIEVSLNNSEYPEWIDLEEMYQFDLDHPYFINSIKPFYNELNSVVIIASVYFPVGHNIISSNLGAYLFKGIRITYEEAVA